MAEYCNEFIMEEDPVENFAMQQVVPSRGVPAGGSAGQILRKKSAADYDTEWDSLDAGDVSFDSSLTYAAGTVGKELSSQRNTLTHKADAIYDTASGDIASFPDGADGLPVKDLTVGIEPVQSGSGDPSPTNVRPISGWTGAKIAHNSGNLLNLNSTPVISNGVTITLLEDGFRASCTSVGNWKQISFPITIPIDGIYTLSATVNMVSGSNPFADCGFTPEVASEIIKRSGNRQTNGNIYYTRRMTAGTYYATYWVSGGTASENVIEYHNVKAELGIPSDPYVPTPFVPYNGNDLIPISWQSEAGTVYGGTLDVTSGVLTVDRGIKVLNGSEDWAEYASGNGFRLLLSEMKSGEGQDGIASYLPTVDGLSVLGIEFGRNDKRIYLAQALTIDGVSNLSSWISYLESNQLQIVFPLATPQTYHLDPIEVITTLLGQNNIWADTGDSAVEYPANTKLYIDKKLAALVAALS